MFAEVPDMGLVLQWDHGTRAYLRLDPQWQGKVGTELEILTFEELITDTHLAFVE